MESNQSKPKMPKHLGNKLPDAFLIPKTINMKKERKVEDNHHQIQSKKEKQRQKERQKEKERERGAEEENPKEKKLKESQRNKNPFQPMWQFNKMLSKIQNEIRQFNDDISHGKFAAKYSEGVGVGVGPVSNHNAKESTTTPTLKNKYDLKYQNFHTLSFIKRTTTGCLKKVHNILYQQVLHVPTLSLFYIKESLISQSITHHQLLEWKESSNAAANSNPNSNSSTAPAPICSKIIEIFWNIPQTYYSVVYQYSEGITLQWLLQGINTLPHSILACIANAHKLTNIGIYLTLIVGIFNAQILLNEGNEVRYLPLYEEGEASVLYPVGLHSIVQQESTCVNVSEVQASERKLIYKLGILLMICYIGEVIVEEDIKLIGGGRECCLFHQMISNDASLSKVMLEGNRCIPVEEFICKCLKSNAYISLGGLKEGKPIKSNVSPSVIRLNEYQMILEPPMTASHLTHSKLSKVMESINLILQNVDTHIESASITKELKGVVGLAKQMGVLPSKIVQHLKPLYN